MIKNNKKQGDTMKTRIILFIITMLIVTCLNAETIAEPPINFGETNSGTPENPFQISNLANLRWMSETPEYWGSGYYGFPYGIVVTSYYYYILTADIDASETMNWNDGFGFQSIGRSVEEPFVGSFEGNGHSITNLTHNDPNNDYIGLFGYALASRFQNINLVDVSLTGRNFVAGLVASSFYITVINCSVSGNLIGNDWVGGLVGGMGGTADHTDHRSRLEDCYSSANIIMHWTLQGQTAGGSGGLVASMNESDIYRSNFTGTVNGFHAAGGIVGVNGYGLIINSVSSGNIYSEFYAGGISALSFSGTTKNSSASGMVEGGYAIGGLIGSARGNINPALEQCYSIAHVTGNNAYTGGLIGWLEPGASITTSYFYGDITSVSGTKSVGNAVSRSVPYGVGDGTAYGVPHEGISPQPPLRRGANGTAYGVPYEWESNAGGLVGFLENADIWGCYVTSKSSFINVSGLVGIVGNGSSIRHNFWDIETTGVTNLYGTLGTNTLLLNNFGLPTNQMKLASTYEEYYWDFGETWSIDAEINDGYPHFQTSEMVVFFPPRDLKGWVENGNVVLVWEPPLPGSIGELSGYIVYRNGVFLGSPWPFFITTWVDDELGDATQYTYYVIAYYFNLSGSSEPSNIVTVKISNEIPPDPVVLLSPENKAVEVELRPVFRWALPTDGGEIEGLEFYISSVPNKLSRHNTLREPLPADQLIKNTHQTQYIARVHDVESERTSAFPTILPADTTEYTLEIDLEYETTYHWYVIAFNEYGYSFDDQIFSFTTKKKVSEKDENTLSLMTELLGNYPNPFNPETTISFVVGNAFIRSDNPPLPRTDSINASLRNPLTKGGIHVSIDIYNIRGQKIKSLLNDLMVSGEHQVIWNGTDDFGRSVGSGVYFYRMITDEYEETKRMLMLK